MGENSVLAVYEKMQIQKATIRKVKADALRPFQVLHLFCKEKVETRRRASVFGTFFAKKVHKRRAFDLIRRDKVAKKLRQSLHSEMLLCKNHNFATLGEVKIKQTQNL
ncbi:MAG: hypothetical protein GX346_01280 [Clostridiales bacterium]|nr:hypothetical protein [Clostridiales bacterium]